MSEFFYHWLQTLPKASGLYQLQTVKVKVTPNLHTGIFQARTVLKAYYKFTACCIYYGNSDRNKFKKINKYRGYGNESKEINAAANIYSGLGFIGLRDRVPP